MELKEGHCVKPRLKQRRVNTKACQYWERKEYKNILEDRRIKMLSEMLDRVESGNLLKFILYGSDEVEIFNDIPKEKGYGVRLNNAFEQFYKHLKEKFPQIEIDNESAYQLVTDMLTIHEEIYMEMGIFVGAKLAMQLNKKDVIPEEDKLD